MDQSVDLDETDSEETFEFPPAERKVVTQSYDLSVQTLMEQWDQQLLILPEIQREYVWDNGRASRLVESLLLNIPIPVIYLAETNDARYEIIDGHQRVRSVVRFLKNEFALSTLGVLNEYKGRRFHQLPDREQRFLKMRTLRAVVISYESHPTMKFEIFERLNTGSITLNAQELRNSLYRGSFNRLLHDLVKNETFRRIIGTKTPRNRMVDEELLLRFFALREHLDTYRTPLKRFLNNYMLDMRNAPEESLSDLKSSFEETIKKIDTLIGRFAFRLNDEQGEPLERTVNRALFDAQMLVFSWISGEPSRTKRPRVLRELSILYQRQDFLDSIQRATGDRARTRRRIKGIMSALENAGISVQVPFDLND